MKHLPRPCAYCREPLAGRADQRYCSSRCKSKDFRRRQATADDDPNDDGPTAEAPRPAADRPFAKVALRDPFPPSPRRGAGAPGDEGPDEEDDPDEDPDDAPPTGRDLAHLVGHALDGHALDALPAEYRQCVERVLAVRGKALGSKPLRALRDRLAQGIWAYARLAARCPLPPALVAQLTALHRLQELIDEAWEAFAEDRRPVEVHVKKKWRAELQASLSLLGPP